MTKSATEWVFLVSADADIECGAPYLSPSEGLVHILLKQPPIGLEQAGRLLVEGVVGVGLQEQVLEAVDDGVNGQDRFPVFAQNVETHVAIQIDVGVVDCVQTLHFRWRVGVVFANFKLKAESSAPVETLVWTNDQLEL